MPLKHHDIRHFMWIPLATRRASPTLQQPQHGCTATSAGDDNSGAPVPGQRFNGFIPVINGNYS